MKRGVEHDQSLLWAYAARELGGGEERVQEAHLRLARVLELIEQHESMAGALAQRDLGAGHREPGGERHLIGEVDAIAAPLELRIAPHERQDRALLAGVREQRRDLRGDAAAPVYALPPVVLLAAFDRVARAEPRVQVLAGSVASGRITYVVRSRLVGFPDYLTVRALPAQGGGATLAIFSRQRFGLKDMGVNRARVEAWLAALAAALPPGTVRTAPGA